MTVYRPAEKKWHKDLHVECTCDIAWRGRGMVDSRCYFHELVFAIEDLREQGWTVTPSIDYEAGADAFIERLKKLSAGTGEMVALGVEMSMIVAAVDAALGDDDE